MKRGSGIVHSVQALMMGAPSRYGKSAIVNGRAPWAMALGDQGMIKAGIGAGFILTVAAFASLQDIPFDNGAIIIAAAAAALAALLFAVLIRLV